jgi:hypothetical protein
MIYLCGPRKYVDLIHHMLDILSIQLVFFSLSNISIIFSVWFLSVGEFTELQALFL